MTLYKKHILEFIKNYTGGNRRNSHISDDYHGISLEHIEVDK
jgi:hypothetical protein